MRLSKWQLKWICTKSRVWNYPSTFIFRCGRTQNGFGELFSKNQARYFKQFWYLVFFNWKVPLLWRLKWLNICYLIQQFSQQVISEMKINFWNFLNENILSGFFRVASILRKLGEKDGEYHKVEKVIIRHLWSWFNPLTISDPLI